MDTDEHGWQSGFQMIPFTPRTAVWMTVILFGAYFDAAAQLASTQLEGLRIQVDSIYLSGDSRDLDCAMSLKFTGPKADQAISLSPVRIIQAMDDTGKDLMRTNRQRSASHEWLEGKAWQQIRGLKAPTPTAKTIRHLEAEVEFFAPTADTPVLTNFMARSGKVLSHPTLEDCQVAISYENPTNDFPAGSLVIETKKVKSITLKVSDPHNRIVSMAFQKPDGGIFPASPQIEMFNGQRTAFTYTFAQPPPPDLNLIVYVAAPEPSDKIAFTLENIRLPWVELPDFEVTAEAGKLSYGKGTNPCTGSLTLNFTGGQLTNALGIRKLWLTSIEDDSGQTAKVRWPNDRFSALPLTAMGDGRWVRKFVPLVFQSPAPKAIRVLKGEAELVCPNVSSDHIVTIKDFIEQTNKPFDLPLLKTNHVRLTCLGPVNYAAVRQEFLKANSVSENGALLPKESPSTNCNSLQFSLDDPDGAVIATWGNNVLNFLDAKGQPVPVTRVMVSGKFQVYRFTALPSQATQLRIYLALPESLQRVPFQIENISLN
jgi:hypothetical protein